MLYRSQTQSKMFHCIRQADTTQHYSVAFVLQCRCCALTNNNANHAMEKKMHEPTTLVRPVRESYRLYHASFCLVERVWSEY